MEISGIEILVVGVVQCG